MTNTTATKTTHRASCHCGLIKLEVQLDLSRGGSRCNCSICHRIGSTGAMAKPADLKILTDKATFSIYPNAIGARYFCGTCGVHVYGEGNLPEVGGEFVSINLHCIEDLDTNTLTIGYWDGRHNNWEAGMRPQAWPIFA